MGFYETTYVLHSALQEGRLNDIVSAITNKIQSLGAEILYSDNWGRKKLAYLINKEKYGTYIFLQFKLKDSNKLTDLSSEFEHNPNILRYLNIKIDEQDVIESKHKENDKDNKENDKDKTAKKIDDKLKKEKISDNSDSSNKSEKEEA